MATSKYNLTQTDVQQRLEALRAGRSVRELARDMGLSHGYVGDVLTGRKGPGPAILHRLRLRKSEMKIASYQEVA